MNNKLNMPRKAEELCLNALIDMMYIRLDYAIERIIERLPPDMVKEGVDQFTGELYDYSPQLRELYVLRDKLKEYYFDLHL